MKLLVVGECLLRDCEYLKLEGTFLKYCATLSLLACLPWTAHLQMRPVVWSKVSTCIEPQLLVSQPIYVTSVTKVAIHIASWQY